jgi:hypothetical protein
MKTMKKVFATSSIIFLDMLALSAEVSAQETAATMPTNSETFITEKLIEKFASFVDQSTTVAGKNTLGEGEARALASTMQSAFKNTARTESANLLWTPNCAVGQYADYTAGACKSCPYNCDVCKDGNTCVTCRITTFLNSNNGCTYCNDVIDGCRTCANGNSCSACYEEYGWILPIDNV